MKRKKKQINKQKNKKEKNKTKNESTVEWCRLWKSENWESIKRIPSYF